MVIKDWKKEETLAGNIIFYHREKYKQIRIDKGFYERWELKIPNHSIKKFKTKQQALKFAREYMRKH